jgi:protocatechuate 3,4-dioxygenase beta subunit
MNFFTAKLPAPLLFFLLLLPVAPVNGTDLQRTPPDQEGPFYPVERQLDMDNNLLQITGKEGQATGDILHLSGKIIDTRGEPVAGVTVEIWQTDPEGRYLHPRDPSSGPRDPYFQYRGRATTGQDGGYSFTTLVPGTYGSRPPHIHFKVWRDGKTLLTSQIYIANHPDSQVQYRTDPLQTVALQKKEQGVFEASFRIVL